MAKNTRAAQKAAGQLRIAEWAMNQGPRGGKGIQKGGGRAPFFNERKFNASLEKSKKAFPGNEALFPEPIKLPSYIARTSPQPAPAAPAAAPPPPPPPPPAAVAPSQPSPLAPAGDPFEGFGQGSFQAPALKPSEEPAPKEPPSPALTPGSSLVIRDASPRIRRRRSVARQSGQTRLGTGQLRTGSSAASSGGNMSRQLSVGGMTRNTGLNLGKGLMASNQPTMRRSGLGIGR